MKIKLKGTITTAELRQMLYQAVTELEELGVLHVRGSSLYLTPIDEDGDEVRPYRNKRYLKEITIKPPDLSAADEYGLSGISHTIINQLVINRHQSACLSFLKHTTS